MRVKQISISILLVLVLVAFNQVFVRVFNRANQYFSINSLYSYEETTPQKLFDKTWKVLYKDFYEPDLNHQDWEKWKTRYQGMIKTDEDAKLATYFSKKPALLWIGCGNTDFLYKANTDFRNKLDAGGYPYEYMETEGGHIWRNWRIYLSEFVPLLFK